MPVEPCPEYVSLMVRAADGALDAGGRARLDAHVGACAACREALAAQVEVRAVLTRRPAADASPAFGVRVRAAIAAERTPGVPWLAGADFRRWTWRLVPVAAALILGAAYVEHAATTSASAGTASLGALPVSAAIYSSDVSDTSLLSLLLEAGPDDSLGDYLKD